MLRYQVQNPYSVGWISSLPVRKRSLAVDLVSVFASRGFNEQVFQQFLLYVEDPLASGAFLEKRLIKYLQTTTHHP